MANTSPCSSCKYYDPILKGTQPTPRGWCIKKSLYPAHDGRGQTIPDGAVRVPPGETLAKPHIVTGAGVVENCLTFVQLPPARTKEGLRALARGGKK